jgi:protein-S-isoprenylcysteine O-methyltransferase Ste14
MVSLISSEFKVKKRLPPLLFLLFAVVMGVICWGFGFKHNILYPYNLLGLPFLLTGLFIAQTSKKLFIKLKTNVNTFDEPDKLVITGLFKYSRNPMYLGFVIAIIGIALLYQGAISSFVLALLFFVIVDRWYIKFEESAMLNKFGKEYEMYCQNTRRWI